MKIEKHLRKCEACGRHFNSGVLHIDRGTVGAMLCHACARNNNFPWSALGVWTWRKNKRLKEAKDANRT